MLNVGIIGWRGMVGSVLLQRMREEGDLDVVNATFFTTSQQGQNGPDGKPLEDAYNLGRLAELDVIITTQGTEYSQKVYPELRQSGWSGYWIDAASWLRSADDAVIILDPVNRALIDQALDKGIKTFVGGNCTVSLMLMAIAPLFRAGLIEWVSSMTYQAASGAGAKHMRELVEQMGQISESARAILADPAAGILELDRQVASTLRSEDFPTANFGAPLAASLIPWIDRKMEDGRSREEWKGMYETNRILGQEDAPVPVDGLCVRVGVMRCHSQALTIKMRKSIRADEVTNLLRDWNPWIRVVPNDPEESKAKLTPAAISGTLEIAVGRIRPMQLGPDFITLFTVGDQLLWGAAEPLRRMLRILNGDI